jgi:cytochrome b involved in lipid metabolism
MKKIYILTLALVLISFSTNVFAATTYTNSDIAKHAVPTDCWTIYDGKVYNITSYINTHDNQYYNIDSWCGIDMTVAYDTMDGNGRGHSRKADSMLASYYIGDLQTSMAITSTPEANSTATVAMPTITENTNVIVAPTTTAVSTSDVLNVKNPYDFWTPFVGVTILYWISNIYVKVNKRTNPKLWPKFNMIWNTIMLLSLIPSALFGIFMIFRYTFPELNNIDFNFLWWHVEGSIVFTVLAFSHLLNRLTQYMAPLKLF